MEMEHVYTCAMATARFLAQQKPGGTAFVIGEGGLLTALHENGYAIVDRDPDYVVVGEGRTISFELVEAALKMILGGAKLVATNLDPNCPTESGLRPGCGATVAMLETASGIKAFSVGKPSPVMLRSARKELGLTTDQTIVIGDTMETDILGGVQLGFKTILVLSGGTNRDDLDPLRLPTPQDRRFGRRPRSRETDPRVYNGRAGPHHDRQANTSPARGGNPGLSAPSRPGRSGSRSPDATPPRFRRADRRDDRDTTPGGMTFGQAISFPTGQLEERSDIIKLITTGGPLVAKPLVEVAGGSHHSSAPASGLCQRDDHTERGRGTGQLGSDEGRCRHRPRDGLGLA